METNSQQLFLDNLRLKQLIQRKQLIKQLQNPNYSKYYVPPLGTYLPTAPVMSNYQQNFFPFTGFNIPLLDNHYNSYPTNPSPLPASDNFPSTYTMPTYPLPFPKSQAFKWPKENYTSAEDAEFARSTNLDPNNLQFHDLHRLGLLNPSSGQVFTRFNNDVIPVYNSLGLYPTHFKIQPNLKKRLTFLEHEKEGFRDYNRLW